jgi:hypothetical protein
MEKALLAALGDPIRGWTEDEEGERFSTAVARHRARFAFPDGLDVVLNPLRKRFRDKRNRESPEARRIDDLWDIRVKRSDGTPWDGSHGGPVEVELNFVIDPSSLVLLPDELEDVPVTSAVKAWGETHLEPSEIASKLEVVTNEVDRRYLWEKLVDGWARKCATDSNVTLFGATAVSAEGYSLARSRREPSLDLDHLSHL